MKTTIKFMVFFCKLIHSDNLEELWQLVFKMEYCGTNNNCQETHTCSICRKTHQCHTRTGRPLKACDKCRKRRKEFQGSRKREVKMVSIKKIAVEVVVIVTTTSIFNTEEIKNNNGKEEERC